MLFSCDPVDLQRAIDTFNEGTVLSNDDVALGLKEALNKGVSNGVTHLSTTDGYYKSAYKILLPEEAQMLVDKLKIIPGFDKVEEEIVKKLNRSAELAASKAKPIFIDAIRKMSFKDAMNILFGKQNAATQYLHANTYNPLYSEFQPVVINSLNHYNALDYWTEVVNRYNSIPFVKKMNPKLEEYVTHKALEGVFGMVEKKELAIRTDIKERTSDLLKRVFAKQDK